MKVPMRFRGEMLGALHELCFISDELDALPAMRDLGLALKRLDYHHRNYQATLFIFRERMLGMLGSVLTSFMVKALRNPKERSKALAQLSLKAPRAADATKELLTLLSDDIKGRNFQVHELSWHLALWVGGQPYDPADTLLELENSPRDRRAMVRLVRSELRRLAAEYNAKIRGIWEAGCAFLEASEEEIPD